MANLKKGKKEVERMKEAAHTKVNEANRPQRERVARAGELGDEQAAALGDARQKQRNLAGLPNYEEGSDAERK